jgi:autotransporter-associated beta strand protein
MKLSDSTAAKVQNLVVKAIVSFGNSLYNYFVYTNQSVSRVATGAVTIYKNGTGTLIFTGSNASYTGGATINSGTLQIGDGTNATAQVRGTMTLSGGNLAYNYNATNFNVSQALTVTASATITKLNGLYQMNFVSGTLNGGGQTLNIFVDTTAGVKPLYFNQPVGTSLGQVNILSGSVGQDGTSGVSRPLQNATMNIASGAQLQTYQLVSSVTINNNITLNGGAGPDGTGALFNSSPDPARNALYTGTITLATSTNSSIGGIFSGFQFTGQITGGGSFTKILSGMVATYGNNNNYTGTTTISAGTLRVLKNFGEITPTASFTLTTLSVEFSGTPDSGISTFRFFQGSTTNTYASVTLLSVPVGTTGSYNSSTSTLTIIVP